MRLIISVVCLVVSGMLAMSAFSGIPVPGKGYSQYVSLQPGSCKSPDRLILAHYRARGLAVSECASRVTWRDVPVSLLIVSSDARSWIDVSAGNTIWSGEEEIVYRQENQFGHFPNIGNSPAEIRMNSAGVTGVIVRVLAQNPESLSASRVSGISRLFVFGFVGSDVCFMGFVQDNVSARNRLDSRQLCKRMLKKYRISGPEQ